MEHIHRKALLNSFYFFIFQKRFFSNLSKPPTNSCIITWDRHSNYFGDGFKSNVISTKSPNKVLNVSGILLVRLGGQKWLGKPFTMINILDMTNFNKLCDGFFNQGSFKRAKSRFSEPYGPIIPSVNFTLVIFDRCSNSLFSEQAPVLINNCS